MASPWDRYWDRLDSNRRNRVEMAQAFNEFRRLNPYASLTEMQGYIDQMAGGSNYLRGGMPSGQVLGGIAEQNRKALAQKEAADRLAMIQQEVQTSDMLGGLAEKALIAANGDITKASQIFQGNLGGNLQGLNVDGLITQENWGRIQNRMVMDNYPRAKELILGMIGEGTTPSPKEIAQITGMPESVAEQMIAKAQSDWDMSEAERKREVRRQISQDETGNLNWTMTYLQNNPDAKYEDVRDELIRRYGYHDTPQDFPEDLVRTMFDNAQRKFKEDQDRLALERERTTNQELVDLQGKLLSDPHFELLVRSGKIDLAQKHIQNMLPGYSPEAVAKITDDWVNQVIANKREAMSVAMQMQNMQAREEGAAAAYTAGQEVVSTSARNAQDLAAPFPDQAKITLQDLADEFFIDANAAAAFQMAVNAVGPDNLGDPTALREEAIRQFQLAGIKPLKTAVQETRDGYFEQIGAMPVLTFDDWHGDVRSTIDETFTNFEDVFSTAMSNKNPTARLQDLKVLKQQLTQASRDIAGAVSQQSQDKFRFLDPVSTWDSERENALYQSLDQRTSTYMAQIDAQIAKAEEEAAAAPPPATTSAPAASATTTPARVMIGGAMDNLSMQRRLGAMASTMSPTGIGRAVDWFSMPQDQYDAEGYVMRLIRDQRFRDFLMEDPTRLDAFEKDPIAFLNQLPPEQLKDVAGSYGLVPSFDWSTR